MATAAPITGAPTCAPSNIVPLLGNEPHLHLKAPPPRVASRRDLLAFAGAATALGAAVATGATVVASEALAAPNAAPTPFTRGLARYEAAEARYETLTGLSFEESEREGEVYMTEYERLQALRPASAEEFVRLFTIAARTGSLGHGDAMCVAMLADAKRLTGAA